MFSETIEFVHLIETVLQESACSTMMKTPLGEWQPVSECWGLNPGSANAHLWAAVVTQMLALCDTQEIQMKFRVPGFDLAQTQLFMGIWGQTGG